MDFSEFLPGLTNSIISFAQNNTIIAVIMALILLYLLFRKTKLFLGLLSLVLIVALLFYIIENLAGPGLETKKKLIEKEQTQSENQ